MGICLLRGETLPHWSALHDQHQGIFRHSLEQVYDVCIGHAYASDGSWLPDHTFLVSSVYVDMALIGIDAASVVYSGLQAFETQNAGGHQVIR